LFRFIKLKILRFGHNKFTGIKIYNYALLNVKKQLGLTSFILDTLKWLMILIAVYLTFPIIFSFFPWTEKLASTLLSYVLDPIKSFLTAIWQYLPNLFTIAVIVVIFYYLEKLFRFLRDEIANENLRISGFYPDWAKPTYQIIRIIVFAFMLVLIFPYLPGSNSPVFQGISVFLGVLFTFGSSGPLSNSISGIVLTYMRTFKIGDRVKIGEVVGDVIEKNGLVVRVRTIKNEIVSIPNVTAMNSHTINYSSEAKEKGLILYTSVTIGYNAPWRKIHELLIEAAKATPLIEKNPEPFVFQTSLNDFFVTYQINAYTKNANAQQSTYSLLHQNIQEKFNEAGVEIMSPHYASIRDGNHTSIPQDYLSEKYKSASFNVQVKKDDSTKEE
jgi:small-conductance mechanosensitive channel